jgi:enamine deaminase RidA (YjgF/YER057c/UK114 family)
MSIDVRAKLAEKGLTLPVAAKPVAAYVPATRTGNIVFTAGQLPLVNGAIPDTGKVGAEITQERAKELAQICALNCLAAVELVVPVDMIVKVVRVVCYVNGAPGFISQPFVANGASELFMHIWGDSGIAARSAIGVAELPLNSPVELELTVEVAELKGSSANAYLGGQDQQSILNDRPA